MRKYFLPAFIISLLQYANTVFAQDLLFNHVMDVGLNGTKAGSILGIAQDQQGYIWFSVGTGGGGSGGLFRYDGSKTISFVHDKKNKNSLGNNWAECLIVDGSNKVWIGTSGGLDRYDPVTDSFTHYIHTSNNASLVSDSVYALLEDHNGNLWVGTERGLDLLNRKTGEFTHYNNIPNDPGSLSDNVVRVIYEDHNGTLWVGCGSPWDKNPESGGLNRFNSKTGKFIRYLHNPTDPLSI